MTPTDTMINTLNDALTTCRMELCWQVWVELAERDDARIREALIAAVGLRYGAYEGVAFESAYGTQFFRPLSGSAMGDAQRTVEMPTRVLSFTLARDTDTLVRAIEAVREVHSYEEPVIVVRDALVSRADDSGQRDNPNRWWNRGFAE